MPRTRGALRGCRAIAAAAASIVLFAGQQSVAVGATAPPQVQVEPNAVGPGSAITVSGSGCPQPGWDPLLSWNVHVQIHPQGDDLDAGHITEPSGTPVTHIGFTAEGYPGRADANVQPSTNGSWTVQLTVPGGGDTSAAATSGSYPVGALCYAGEGAEAGLVRYAEAALTVTVAPKPIVVAPSLTG